MTAMPSPSSSPMLEWALRYAAMGWPVLPIRGKKPLTEHGYKDATTDDAQIRRWFQNNTSNNIGIHCCKFWVLDIDPPKGGDESLELLESQYGKLDTLTQITGSGGRHLLFANPNFDVALSASKIAPGIDVRGATGYIAAAPSIHPDTGKPYFWDGMEEFEQQPINPAPQWLLDLLRKPAPPATPTIIPDKIRHPYRHRTLVSLAGSLRKRGCGAEEILAAIRATNSARCEPPYDDKHLQQIANSMEKYQTALPSAEEAAPAEESEVTTLPDWTRMLQRNDKGKPIPNVVNTSLPLNFDPAFADAIRFNLLRSSIEISRNIPEMLVYNAPCEWADKHDIAYAAWCQTKGIQIAPTTAAHAAILISNLRSFHPVQEYLNSLAWDGVPRITTWLNAYCGVEDNLYTQTVGRKWLISAVNRALHPGCKVDSCLILEGKQNIGKSRALNILGGDWYTDQIKDLDSNDAALQASRVWIVEIGELDAFRKSETTAFKAFLSRQIDQFRPAYGRHVQTFPRQCVFAGTTNQDQYLHDETGNRRFWPVRCHQILQNALATDRDQLWAEAVVAANSGEPCWIEDIDVITAATGEANTRFINDAWAEKLIPWMVDRFSMGDRFVTTAQLLESCLDMRTKDWTQRDQERVAKILRQLHFDRRKFRAGPSLVWGFLPSPDSPPPFS